MTIIKQVFRRHRRVNKSTIKMLIRQGVRVYGAVVVVGHILGDDDDDEGELSLPVSIF